MDRSPLRAIAEEHGAFLRAEALDLGFDDRALARGRRSGQLTRIRHGAYTFTDLWQAQDAVGQHRLHALAVHRRYADRVAFSHTTAAVLHGMDVWAVDLSKVHLTRLDRGAGRTEADLVHHEGLWLADDIGRHDGVLVTNPTRAVLETAGVASVEAGLVTADSALRAGLTSNSDLVAAHDGLARWPGTQHVHLVVAMADGRSDSAGETRARHLFWAAGLPLPELQFDVRRPNGELAGTTDFAWRLSRLLGEFDGRVKYGRLLRPGETPGDAVFREKQREDLLRELTGWRFIRLVWADLQRPRETVARLRAALQLAA